MQTHTRAQHIRVTTLGDTEVRSLSNRPQRSSAYLALLVVLQ